MEQNSVFPAHYILVSFYNCYQTKMNMKLQGVIFKVRYKTSK